MSAGLSGGIFRAGDLSEENVRSDVRGSFGGEEMSWENIREYPKVFEKELFRRICLKGNIRT